MDEKVVIIHGLEPLKSRWASTTSPVKAPAQLGAGKATADSPSTPKRSPRKVVKPHQSMGSSSSHQQTPGDLPDLFTPPSSATKRVQNETPRRGHGSARSRQNQEPKHQPAKVTVSDFNPMVNIQEPFNWADDSD